MKTCSKCNTLYEDYGQRNSFCKPCKRKYDREYHTNRSTEKKKRKQDLQSVRIARIRKEFDAHKESSGCYLCDESETVCLDLHHLDPNEKEINVADAIRLGWSKEKIQAEVDKCVVLCANCHRKVHKGLITLLE